MMMFGITDIKQQSWAIQIYIYKAPGGHPSLLEKLIYFRFVTKVTLQHNLYIPMYYADTTLFVLV